ncbi:MAG: hypothetical protein QXL51_00295 [Candidatus Aenigmatarchaeota archaeon]
MEERLLQLLYVKEKMDEIMSLISSFEEEKYGELLNNLLNVQIFLNEEINKIMEIRYEQTRS